MTMVKYNSDIESHISPSKADYEHSVAILLENINLVKNQYNTLYQQESK